MKKDINILKESFNEYLKRYIQDEIYLNREIKEMIEYVMISDGKRLRPLLFLLSIESFGLSATNYFDIALAIEMVHMHTLIFDDLPSMDDDDIRHGKTTIHKKYSESSAILIADGLIIESYKLIVSNQSIKNIYKNRLVDKLSEYVGFRGLVKGQYFDINLKVSSLEDVKIININKTGKLFSYSFVAAAIICEKMAIDSYYDFGIDLGILFQMQDDLFEAISTTDDIGKDVKSDINNKKSNYLTINGVEKTKIEIDNLYNKLVSSAENLEFSNRIFDLLAIIYARSK